MKSIKIETSNAPTCTVNHLEAADISRLSGHHDKVAEFVNSHFVNHIIRTKQRGKSPAESYDIFVMIEEWTTARDGMPTKADVEQAVAILHTIRVRRKEGIAWEELDARITAALKNSYPLWGGECLLPEKEVTNEGGQEASDCIEYLAGLIREARLAKAKPISGI